MEINKKKTITMSQIVCANADMAFHVEKCSLETLSTLSWYYLFNPKGERAILGFARVENEHRFIALDPMLYIEGVGSGEITPVADIPGADQSLFLLDPGAYLPKGYSWGDYMPLAIIASRIWMRPVTFVPPSNN